VKRVDETGKLSPTAAGERLLRNEIVHLLEQNLVRAGLVGMRARFPQAGRPRDPRDGRATH
jgi:hypothetical protein